ncbi:hypothetical protein BDZ89DRAFT_1074049 [Hymenopellis radicata]|nr:hypothetical protein BDZ89DRAFT_1074049 [Hymenopellis radicata]
MLPPPYCPSSKQLRLVDCIPTKPALPSTIPPQITLFLDADSVVEPSCTEEQDTPKHSPTTPRASRFRPTMISSASPPSSPLASATYDAAHSSYSPHSPSLMKRLFEDEVASSRLCKKSRMLKDSNQERKSGQLVGESFQARYESDNRQRGTNRSIGKRTKEHAPFIGG